MAGQSFFYEVRALVNCMYRQSVMYSVTNSHLQFKYSGIVYSKDQRLCCIFYTTSKERVKSGAAPFFHSLVRTLKAYLFWGTSHFVLWLQINFMQLRNLCVLGQKSQFQMYVDFIYAWLSTWGCGYPHCRYKWCELYFSVTIIIFCKNSGEKWVLQRHPGSNLSLRYQSPCDVRLSQGVAHWDEVSLTPPIRHGLCNLRCLCK